jgi:hypothetical protein
MGASNLPSLPPSPVLHTLFQVAYPASPVFTTLTKTAGVYTNNSHLGTHFRPLGACLGRSNSQRNGTGSRGTNWRAGRIIWQGVDYVLRRMREPTHPGGTILHEVREGRTTGRNDGVFGDRASPWVNGNLWRAGWNHDRNGRGNAWHGSGNDRWAGAPEHPPSSDTLDD